MPEWLFKKKKMTSHQQNGWQIHCISIIFGNYIVTCMKVREWDDYRRASVLLSPWKKWTRKYWFALLFIWQTYSFNLLGDLNVLCAHVIDCAWWINCTHYQKVRKQWIFSMNIVSHSWNKMAVQAENFNSQLQKLKGCNFKIEILPISSI